MILDLWLAAATADAEVERLWPGESMSERVNCLAEEVGEVSRALTKRRHAVRDGSCKGMTPEEWTANVRVEVAQVVLVALTIASREGFDLAPAVIQQIEALRATPSPSPAGSGPKEANRG